MAETAAFLADYVVPFAPVRQWVLSFPSPVRYILAANPTLKARVLELVIRAIATYLKQKAKERGAPTHTQAGSVTLVQRFGGSVNLNIHFHILFLDGVYSSSGGTPQFHGIASPTTQDIEAMVKRIAQRVRNCLARSGYFDRAIGCYDGGSDVLRTEQPLLSDIVSASVQYRIALGERAGAQVQRINAGENLDREDQNLTGTRCASFEGFSLHANTVCAAGERDKLERLCRYVARPPIAHERLTASSSGKILYRLKTPYRDGTSHVMFTPLELMEKLAALVPRPRIHLIRYHGVFAPNAAWRSSIVRQVQEPDEKDAKKKPSRVRMTWAQLIKRVFDVDLKTCPSCCSGQLKIIAAIMRREVVERILKHLALPHEIPKVWPARGPPQPVLLN